MNLPVKSRPQRRTWYFWALAIAVSVSAIALASGSGPATARKMSGDTRAGAAVQSAALAAARVPAACALNGTYVWKHLHTCGWASPRSTGYSLAACPGHELVRKGSNAEHIYHITKAHAVISCRNITGCLSIEAQHVAVRNVNIACTSGTTGENANGTGVIKVQDGASATIRGVTINGMKGVHACIWHQGTAMTADRVNCSHVDDGIFSWADTGYSQTTGNHFTIENSYFHAFTTRTSNGHIDGYQTEGAAYGTIKHNTYLMTADDHNGTDSAIAIWNSLKSSHDITVRHNLIAGGGFAIYAEDYSPSESDPSGGYTVTRIRLEDNVFSQRLFGCVGYWGVWFSRGMPTDGWRRSGNYVLETGRKINSGNPSYHGHSCS